MSTAFIPASIVRCLTTPLPSNCWSDYKLIFKINLLHMNQKICFKQLIGTLLLTVLLMMGSCTKLDEQLYDRITSVNFLQSKDDVIRDFLRAFEHSYWSIQGGS